MQLGMLLAVGAETYSLTVIPVGCRVTEYPRSSPQFPQLSPVPNAPQHPFPSPFSTPPQPQLKRHRGRQRRWRRCARACKRMPAAGKHRPPQQLWQHQRHPRPRRLPRQQGGERRRPEPPSLRVARLAALPPLLPLTTLPPPLGLQRWGWKRRRPGPSPPRPPAAQSATATALPLAALSATSTRHLRKRALPRWLLLRRPPQHLRLRGRKRRRPGLSPQRLVACPSAAQAPRRLRAALRSWPQRQPHSAAGVSPRRRRRRPPAHARRPRRPLLLLPAVGHPCSWNAPRALPAAHGCPPALLSTVCPTVSSGITAWHCVRRRLLLRRRRHSGAAWALPGRARARPRPWPRRPWAVLRPSRPAAVAPRATVQLHAAPAHRAPPRRAASQARGAMEARLRFMTRRLALSRCGSIARSQAAATLALSIDRALRTSTGTISTAVASTLGCGTCRRRSRALAPPVPPQVYGQRQPLPQWSLSLAPRKPGGLLLRPDARIRSAPALQRSLRQPPFARPARVPAPRTQRTFSHVTSS